MLGSPAGPGMHTGGGKSVFVNFVTGISGGVAVNACHLTLSNGRIQKIDFFVFSRLTDGTSC
jgi:hypothetical protein